VYQSFLNTLLAGATADFPWAWKMHMQPMVNIGANSGTIGSFNNMRQVQRDWAADTSTTNNRVTPGGNYVDLSLVDTVHPTANLTGMGRIAERFAQDVLFSEGVATTSPVGAEIVSADWLGANIDLTIQHNGGTDLVLPTPANMITGFRASVDNFATMLTITGAAITSPTTVRLTLSATPASAPRVDYQNGAPGTTFTPLVNGLIPGVQNPLYDNRPAFFSAAPGIPVMFTRGYIQSVSSVPPVTMTAPTISITTVSLSG
jgi:hypothetical protein